MDVPYDQLIDTAIMVLAYLVAGTLGAVIYSAVARRKAAPSRQGVQVAAARTAPAAPAARPSVAPDRLQYVDFRRTDSMNAHGDLAGAVSRVPALGSTRRDRAEIIRLAREMIKAKTPQETIKRTLPISDGELALLQGSNN
jgi:hypothetical protein